MKKLVLFFFIVLTISCEKDKEFSYNPKIDSYTDYKSEYSRIIFVCNKNLTKIDSTFLQSELELALDNFGGLWSSLAILKDKGIDLLNKNILEPTRTTQLNELIDRTSDTILYYKQKQTNLDEVIKEDIELFIHFNQVVDFMRNPNYGEQTDATVAENSSAYLQNSPGFNSLNHFRTRPDHAIISYFTNNMHTAKTKLYPLALATLDAYELRAVWSHLNTNGSKIESLLAKTNSISDLEKIYNICVRNGMYMISEKRNFPFELMINFATKSKNLLEVHKEYNSWIDYYNNISTNPQQLINDADLLTSSASLVSSNEDGILAFETYISEYKTNFNYLHYLATKPVLVANWQVNSSANITEIQNLFESTKDSIQIKNSELIQSISEKNDNVKMLLTVYEEESPNISYFFNESYFDLYQDSSITDNTGWKLIQLKGKAGIQD